MRIRNTGKTVGFLVLGMTLLIITIISSTSLKLTFGRIENTEVTAMPAIDAAATAFYFGTVEDGDSCLTCDLVAPQELALTLLGMMDSDDDTALALRILMKTNNAIADTSLHVLM